MKGCLIKLWKIVLYTLGGITALVLLAIILSLFAKPKATQSPTTTPVAAKQAVAIAQASTSTTAPPTAGPSATSPPPTNTPQPTPAPLPTDTPLPTSPPTQTPLPTDTPLPQNEILITQERYGDEWPFTVKQGILSCENVSEVVVTVDGVSFAINGTAKSTKRYQPVEKIWADNPAIPGTKKSVGGIIKSGLALCP